MIMIVYFYKAHIQLTLDMCFTILKHGTYIQFCITRKYNHTAAISAQIQVHSHIVTHTQKDFRFLNALGGRGGFEPMSPEFGDKHSRPLHNRATSHTTKLTWSVSHINCFVNALTMKAPRFYSAYFLASLTVACQVGFSI